MTSPSKESPAAIAMADLPKESPTAEAQANDEKLDPDFLHGWTLAITTISLCLGTFLMALDTTIVGVAIPKITSAFHSLADIGWYGTSYLLPLTAFQPTYGILYKHFSLKYVYLLSVIVFEIGSAISAAAPSSIVFIIGRSIAGLGGAGLLQGALSILAVSVPINKIAIYHGYIISVFGISACTGPIIGGVLTDQTSWRWCFYINLPIGAVVMVLVPIFVKAKTSSDSSRLSVMARIRSIDFGGTVFFLGAMASLFLVLQWTAEGRAWSSPTIIGLLVCFVASLAIFSVIQWKLGEKALIPPRVLTHRAVFWGTLYLFFFGLNVAVYNNYVPVFLQSVKAFSATASGVSMIALDVTRVVFTVAAGIFVTKDGRYWHLMLAGNILIAIGSGFMTTLDLQTWKIDWAWPLVLIGAGAGIGGNHAFTVLPTLLSSEDTAVGNAIAVFGMQLGGALALGISQTLLIKGILAQLASNPLTQGLSTESVISAGASNLEALAPTEGTLRAIREAYSSGIRDIMILALVSISLAVLVVFGMPNINIKASRPVQEDLMPDLDKEEPQHHSNNDLPAAQEISQSKVE